MKEYTCDDCGKTSLIVMNTNCPYAKEISGTIIQAYLCPDCYHER